MPDASASHRPKVRRDRRAEPVARNVLRSTRRGFERARFRTIAPNPSAPNPSRRNCRTRIIGVGLSRRTRRGRSHRELSRRTRSGRGVAPNSQRSRRRTEPEAVEALHRTRGARGVAPSWRRSKCRTDPAGGVLLHSNHRNRIVVFERLRSAVENETMCRKCQIVMPCRAWRGMIEKCVSHLRHGFATRDPIAGGGFSRGRRCRVGFDGGRPTR